MNSLTASSARQKTIWPWLFPFAYLIHITEEYVGGGALYIAALTKLKGVDLTSRQFLIINGVAFPLLILGIILSQKFNFPEWMLVCLGTIFLINGFAHTIASLAMADYHPGLITGILIFIPLGVLTLIRLKTRMSARRYLMAIVVGIAIHGVVTLLAFKGGRLFGI